jgi:hypothetical protein
VTRDPLHMDRYIKKLITEAMTEKHSSFLSYNFKHLMMIILVKTCGAKLLKS